ELKERKVKEKGVKGKGFGFVRKRFKSKGEDVVVDSDSDDEAKEKTMITPMFRVDGISLGDDVGKDDAKLIDEKIKIFSEKNKSEDEGKQAASKAVELAKDHIKEKEKEMEAPKELKTDKKIEKTKPAESSIDKEKNIDHEHVFFDEEELSDKGWSPQVSKSEKNVIMPQSSNQQEIDPKALGEVGYLELPDDAIKTDSVKLSDLGFSENQWEELDFYSLNEPFAYVEILREKETLDKCYFLVEIALTKDEEKTLTFIKETLANISFNTDELEEKGYEKYLTERLDQVIQEYNIMLSEESRKKIFYYIEKSSLGLGKIDPLMKDPNIEDISCDGAGVPVFLYHRKYGSLKSNVHFNDEDELSSFVHRLAQKSGKHISIAEPMLDATMPDGSRIQMTLSDEITAKGSTFTIRKFRDDPFSPPDLVEFNTMSSEMVAYMWLAVENGINTLFAGGTASGKTTALNALSLFIPRESKIVSIEETREINLPHPNWIPGVARSGFGEVVAGKVIGEIDLYDLMKAALRQRPEYILVGEIRGREAYVLFQAMATGHATYSTVHADSAQSLIHRLEGKPINIPRVMLQSLDVVCLHVITRVKNMRARRCKQIIEIIDIDPTTKEILTNEVFRWDPVEDKFIYSGKSYVLERVRGEKDLSREEMTQEINRRRKIVEWMNKTNVREFRGVAKIVAQYFENSEDVMKKIEKDDKK
ncbi:MAG: type II/IV secretion system ATPase subunit, partial [Thermoplasmatales archaeon]